MKKSFKFLLGTALVVGLSISSLLLQTAQALPTSGGTGTSADIGRINCVYKRNGSVSSTLHNVVIIIGTDKYFYVENNSPASAYPYNVNDPAGKVYPIAKYKKNTSGYSTEGGSMTNRLSFYYQTPEGGDNVTADARDVNLNPLIKLNMEGVYTLTADGSKYYPFDASNINDPYLPVCAGPSTGVNLPPTCSDGIKNQDETGIDTGGVCTSTGSSGSSSGSSGPFVEKNTCTDGIKNGDETDIDVGGRCNVDTAMITPSGPGTNAGMFGHWPTATRPAKINYINNLAPRYSKWLPIAIKDWNLAGEGAILLSQGDSSVPIQVTVTSGDFGATGWVGVVNATQGHLTFAPMRVNDYYLLSAAYLNDDSQRRYVVAHELGHTLGLDHQDVNFSNPNACSLMDYTGDTDGSKSGQCTNLHPNADDSTKLKAEYINHTP